MNEKKLWCNNYTLTPVCKWYLEEFLRLDNYSVTVNCCVFLQWGKAGHFTPPDQVQLAQDLDGIEKFHALFHELRHYFQFKQGLWDFNPEPYLNRNKKYLTELEKQLDYYWQYRQFPWELDANENSMKALTAFWKSDVSSAFRPPSSPTLLSRVLGRIRQSIPV